MPLRLQATEDDVYHLMDLKEQYFIMTAICSVAEGISAYFFIYQKRCWDLVYFVCCTGACDNPASSSGHKNQPEDHGGRKLLYGT